MERCKTKHELLAWIKDAWIGLIDIDNPDYDTNIAKLKEQFEEKCIDLDEIKSIKSKHVNTLNNALIDHLNANRIFEGKPYKYIKTEDTKYIIHMLNLYLPLINSVLDYSSTKIQFALLQTALTTIEKVRN
jgi:hypothetical protein